MDNKMEEVKTAKYDESADRAGLLVSVLCCLHCMAIPLLIIFVPSLATFFENPLIHSLAILIIVPVGLYAFIKNLKVHNDKRPLFIGILGMATILVGHFNQYFLAEHAGHMHMHSHSHAIGTVEVVASIIGGLALIAAHLLNIKLCRCNHCEH